jgi:hypothetical protein
MLHEKVSSEKEMSAKTLLESHNLLEAEFKTRYLHTSLEQIEIRDDGTAMVESQDLPYSPGFLDALRSLIKMPEPFALEIDFDLFRYNFDQLKRQHCAGVIVCISRDIAVNVCKGTYFPAHTGDVLKHLPEKFAHMDFHEGLLSDRGAELSWYHPDFQINPRPGDSILVGFRISNSETGFRGLKASVFTLRCVCRNGTLVVDEANVVRWTYDRRVTYASNIQKFCTELKDLEADLAVLTTQYSRMVDRPIQDREVVNLWRRIRRAVGPEQADAILGLTADARRKLTIQVRSYAHSQETQPTDLVAYDVHNRITQSAQGYPMLQRRRLEEIGGDMLYEISSN